MKPFVSSDVLSHTNRWSYFWCVDKPSGVTALCSRFVSRRWEVPKGSKIRVHAYNTKPHNNAVMVYVQLRRQEHTLNWIRWSSTPRCSNSTLTYVQDKLLPHLLNGEKRQIWLEVEIL